MGPPLWGGQLGHVQGWCYYAEGCITSYSIIKAHGPDLKAGCKAFAHTFWTNFHVNAARCVFIFHKVVAVEEKLAKSRGNTDLQRKGGRSCGRCELCSLCSVDLHQFSS